MQIDKQTKAITPIDNHANPHAEGVSKNSLKEGFRQQIRNFKIECRHAWKNKDFQKIWYYAIHGLGFISYSAICLLMALIFGVVFTISGITNRGRKKHGDDVTNISMKFVEDILVVIYRLMAGMFGWPDINHKIYRIPFVILNTIIAKVRPNRVTQFFGYGTLTVLTYLLFTNFSYIVYRLRTLFGSQPQYY